MPMMRRDDGVVFVLQPYRETLTIKNTSLLRKEIRYLAEAHGNNVRLFKVDGGNYEAAFSQDSGYLLGETVWHHFDKPSDLIYCEVLNKEEKQALLVVVREGKVYLDAKLSFDNLNDEVSGLLTENAGRYLVYLYGEMPVDFSHTSVKTLSKLPHPLFSTLNADEKYRLLPITQALDEFHLGTKQRSSLIVVTAICLVILGGLWWYAKTKPMTVTINPYEQYELALQTPDPGQQISSLMQGLTSINSISGWLPVSFDYNGQVAQVPVQSLGGTATELLTYSQQLGMNVNFSAQGAAINFPTIITDRPTPDKISDTQQVIAVIIDRMMQILPDKSVEVNGTVVNQVFKQTNITISFSNISPEILQLIGSNLDDLPVSMTNCTASIKNGLLSGNLQLAVVGK